ncbi:MAG: hypothetical protein WC728_02100 [Elusimicrobiota bacterium]
MTLKRKTLPEILRERKLVDEDKLKLAEAEVRLSGEPLQTALLKKGLLGKDALLGALKDEWKVEAVDIAGMPLGPETVKLVPEAAARGHWVLPFAREGDRLFVAMADPTDVLLIDDLHFRTGLEIKPFLAMPGEILAGIDAAYSGGPEDPMVIKYGLPDAPRKHLLVLSDGSMEVCDSEGSATSRINELGRGSVREVWEMRKRRIVDKTTT